MGQIKNIKLHIVTDIKKFIASCHGYGKGTNNNIMKGHNSKLSSSITVHNPHIIQSISPEKSQVSKDDFFVPQTRDRLKDESGMRRSNSSFFLNGWLSEKSVKNMQERVDYESSDIQDMYNCLIESEKQIQCDLNSIIENDTEMKKRKVRLRSKKWHEQMYHPLSKKILKEMNGKNYEQLDKEKRKQYTNYLKHQNNKEGNVFLDIFAIEEYNPLYINSQRPGPLKVSTKKLVDPLLHLQDKHNEEERIAIACDLGKTLSDKELETQRLPKLPLIPLGRHGTSCSTWLGMELTDIQSDVRIRKQLRRNVSRIKSTFSFNEHRTAGSSDSDFACNRLWQKKKQFPEKHDTAVELT